MTDLFTTGVRPIIDDHLLKLAAETRDYGDYWSASSAGYCMRKVIFDRLGVPPVKPDPRKQRIFTSGHIFHSWIQELTKAAGVSVAQELELQDEELMIRGHIDDLVLVDELIRADRLGDEDQPGGKYDAPYLILYDYKTQNSRAFSYAAKQEFQLEVKSYFHKMQLGTYMYMLRTKKEPQAFQVNDYAVQNLTEARILKISKDDLRMTEEQLLWSEALEHEVLEWWTMLNNYWKAKKLPPCTCADREGGFMAKETYNPYFYEDEPCSVKWYEKWKQEKANA